MCPEENPRVYRMVRNIRDLYVLPRLSENGVRWQIGTHGIGIGWFGFSIATPDKEFWVVCQIRLPMNPMRLSPDLEGVSHFFNMSPTTGMEFKSVSKRAVQCYNPWILCSSVDNLNKLADFDLQW
jgi:hypothetical protein